MPNWGKVAEKITQDLIVKIIVALLVLATSVIYTLMLKNAELSVYSTCFAIVGCGSLLLAGWLIFCSKKKTPPAKPIEKKYEIQELTIHYLWKSSQEIIYTRHYKILAKQDLSQFEDSFRWSVPDGKLGLSSPEGHRVVPVREQTQYDHIVVHFQYPLKKHKTHDFKVVWKVDDERGVSRPFISRDINAPTKKLKFIVELPSDMGVATAIGEEMVSASTRQQVKGCDLKKSKDGKIEWVVPSPLKLYWHYQVRWDWPAKKT